MNRRRFIAGLSCVAAWPLAARGQQSERTRRIGTRLKWLATSPPSGKVQTDSVRTQYYCR